MTFDAPRPAPAPMPSPVAALADGQWHRMHPATPLLRGGIVLIAVVGLIVSNLRERLVELFVPVPGGAQADDGDPINALVRHGWVGWALLGVLVLVAAVIVGYRLSWRVMEFRVSRDAVELRSGVIFKQHRQARLDRIQGVNVHRPLFARIFGAARLEVVVAGHDANLGLAYLSSAPAEQLRRDILRISRQTLAAETGAAQPSAVAGAAGTVDALLADRIDEFIARPADLRDDGAHPAAIVTVHPGRLLGSIVLSQTTIVILALIVFLIVEASLGHWWLLVAILPSVIGAGSAYVRRFSRLARYAISGTSDGVRLGYGLLATSSETIPAGRIHAVQLVQPLLWRPFGWWALRINRAGRAKQRGQAENANTLLPVGSLADVQRVLPLVLPHVDPALLALLVAQTSAPVARVAAGEPGADAAGSGSLFSRPPQRAAWLHPFSWRRTGFAEGGDVIALRSGFVWRHLTLVPLARLQSIALRQGPLHRMLGLAALHVHVVDGRVNPHLPVIGAAEGRELFEAVAVRAVALTHEEGS